MRVPIPSSASLGKEPLELSKAPEVASQIAHKWHQERQRDYLLPESNSQGPGCNAPASLITAALQRGESGQKSQLSSWD